MAAIGDPMRPLIAARDAALVRLLRAPPGLLRRIAGPPVVIEGRALDLQTQALVALADRFAPKTYEQSVADARRQMDESAPAIGGAPRPVLRTEDFDLEGGVTARLFVPRAAEPNGPLLVWYHGGGFVTGSARSHDRPMRVIADELRAPVLEIDYRLAPEHPFPAAPLDVVRAYLWARERAASFGCDPARVCVGGDSAGGNLAAVVCLAAKDQGLPMPAAQTLVYPATDFTRAMRSHRTFARGFFLEAASIDYYLSRYAAPERDPRASVLFAPRHDGLAPAVVHTAGFDPLVDEGDAYADKLRAAGVPVVHARHDGLVHGYLNMGAIDAPAIAIARVAHDTRAVLELTRR